MPIGHPSDESFQTARARSELNKSTVTPRDVQLLSPVNFESASNFNEKCEEFFGDLNQSQVESRLSQDQEPPEKGSNLNELKNIYFQGILDLKNKHSISELHRQSLADQAFVPPTHRAKVVIVGNERVGKTSMSLRYCFDKFDSAQSVSYSASCL